ncbi:hypothetical protein O1D97_18965 [Marinomonas sp. 15G1-11]|uniref:Tetratricopeptide repeat protein n=1 Tax=Marinomonas phaeophyticola TaxID=3004091 RepID=A0ABT4JZ10_9GAMM|nr:hypothetical protein [Marinomonas sp. 15G1-11]MCZ2723636.1 hypothetical protein [Marinomonas sp. 15G1-11]
MPVLILFIALLIQGCSTYSQSIDKGLAFAQEGRWEEAEEIIAGALESPEDKLLNLLERGALAQYQGSHQRSNQLLEEAEKLSDTFFKQGFVDRSWALLSNPRQGLYRGDSIERVYISYFKSLNYLALADDADNQNERTQLIDAALVESRRIDLKLNEINLQTPSYADIKNENKSFIEKSLNLFSSLYTGQLDKDKYAYRDDAWARYLEGLLYEKANEYDNARIAYQAAATLYEEGYATQYGLSNITAERAWLDTIRMMQRSGGWSSEYPQLIESKLSKEAQQILLDYAQQDSEIVLLEHQGFLPEKQEMSVLLYGDPNSYSLILEPFYGGHTSQQNDALNWFTMVYADINPLSMIANYKAGKASAAIGGFFTKRIILGSKAWRELSRLHFDEALFSSPLRVTIPYYNRFTLDSNETKLSIDQITRHEDNTTETSTALIKTSIRMSSLADIALQDQLNQSQRDIYEGLLREMLRSWIAYQIKSSIKDEGTRQLFDLLGKVAVFASSAAETRNWLTLPAQVRLMRQPVSSGLYNFHYSVNQQHFSLNQVKLDNTMKVWNIRNPN